MSSFQQMDAVRHEYRVRGATSGYPILGAVLIAAVIPLAYVAWTGRVNGPLWFFAGILGVGGAWLLAWSTRSRLVLEGSRVTVAGLTGERTFDTGEIEGYRTIRTRNGSYTVLCLKAGGRPVTLSRFATDGAYDAWFAQLTDLDERDRKAVLEQIEQDQDLGATPQERLAALGSAKWWGWISAGVSGAAAVGAFLGGMNLQAACVAMLVLTPAGVAMAVSRRPLLYAVNQRKGDPRSNLMLPLVISAMGLFMRAVNLNMVHPQELLVIAGVVGLVYIAAFYRMVQGSGQAAGAMISVVMFGALYAWGAVVGVDTAGDARMQVYEAHVTGMHVSRGSRSSTYYLDTEPWGPFDPPIERVQVTGSVYRNTSVGDPVCMGLHPGWLHVQWYALTSCAAAGNAGMP